MLLEKLSTGDTEGEAPFESVPVGVPEVEGVGVRVVLGVGVGETEEVGESVGVKDGVAE